MPTQARMQKRLWRRYRKLYLRGNCFFTHAGEEAEKAVEALETMKLHFTRQVTLLGNLSRTQGETEAEGEGALEGSQESGALMCP